MSNKPCTACFLHHEISFDTPNSCPGWACVKALAKELKKTKEKVKELETKIASSPFPPWGIRGRGA
jgi:hypothetical protein